MGEVLTWRTTEVELAAHNAVRAWVALSPATEVRAVSECLDARGRARPNSAVWRLEVADGGRDVLAKLARRSAVKAEQAVYEQVLSQLPLTAPDLLGSTDHASACDQAWLFLRFMPGRLADLDAPKERVLLAQWLAVVHGATRTLDRPTAIPLQRWDEYIDRRVEASAAIGAISQASLAPGVVANVLLARRVLERLEGRWEDVVAAAQTAPCLTHGDVIGKNVLIDEEQLCIVDWERCSWGSPAEDLADVDLFTYGRVIGDEDTESLRRLQLAGTVLRDLCLIAATAGGIGDWPDRPLAKVAYYASRLDAAMEQL